MKTKITFFKVFVSIVCTLAISTAPVMQCRAGTSGQQIKTIVLVKGGSQAAIQAQIDQAQKNAVKQLLAQYPQYSVNDVQTIPVGTLSTNATSADIKAAVSKALQQQGVNPDGTVILGPDGSPNPQLIAECFVAVIVIIIGTIVIVTLYHLCLKALPPPSTNSDDSGNIVLEKINAAGAPAPRGSSVSATDTNVYAAWIVLGSDPSMEGPAASGNALSMTYTLTSPGTQTGTPSGSFASQPVWVPPTATVSQDVFSKDVAGLGLTFSSTQSSYSINGVPTNSLDNIQFANPNGVVSTDAILTLKVGSSPVAVTNVFEFSAYVTNQYSGAINMVWTPFITIVIAGGGSATMTVTDGNAPAGSRFYKVEMLH